MSEGSIAIVLPTEKGETVENEIMKDNDSKSALHPNESPSAENPEIPAEKEQAQENQLSIESTEPEQTETVQGSLKSNDKATDSSHSEIQLATSDSLTETKFLEKTADGNQPALKSASSDGSTDTKFLEMASGNEPSVKPATSDGSTDTKSLETASGNEPSVKPTTSDGSTDIKTLERSNDVEQTAKSTSTGISPSEVPSDDKRFEEVTGNIQLIYEGLKGMKISTEDIPISASGKKGRKPPTTPRARSTPVLTSPPLTRSRSRDLRKVPSTPSSPKRSATRNTSEGDSDEIKVRGRQRAKKN